jgi:hypothetical protein
MIPILFGTAIVLIAVLAYIALARRTRVDSSLAQRARDNFEESFPPISDAEFLALCSPGTSPEVALKVRRMVAEYFGIEYERVHPSTRFVQDLDH